LQLLSHLVVVEPPRCNRRARLCQRVEPVFIQTLVTKLTVEAFDLAVLHWPAGFDE